MPKTLSTQLIKQGRSFRFVTEEYELDDGRRSQIDKVEHPGAVVILPVSNSGKLIFLKQYRQSLRQTIYELPAGTRERDEDPFACAKREIVEEIGQQAENWQSLGTLWPAPGFCDEVQYCYFASKLSPAFAEQDADEVIEPVEIEVGEVERMISSFELKDSKSVALFLRARLLGLL